MPLKPPVPPPVPQTLPKPRCPGPAVPGSSRSRCQAQGSCGELAGARRAAEAEESRLRDALAKTSELAAGLARDKAELSRRLERLEQERERGRLHTRELCRELALLRARLERGPRPAGERRSLERAEEPRSDGRGLREELRELRGLHERLRQSLGQVGTAGATGRDGRGAGVTGRVPGTTGRVSGVPETGGEGAWGH